MRSLDWTGKSLRVLDQRLLPHEQVWVECTTAEAVGDAITSMKVRGAPAIGAAAAFGIALEAMNLRARDADIKPALDETLEFLAQTRPTAVNLFWAIERMRRVLRAEHRSEDDIVQALVVEAERIAEEDIATNRRIGESGARLFKSSSRILTHCNTGSLATVEYGTALGIIRRLHETHLLSHVWVDETRPYLQGARLTAYELAEEGIPHTLITDSMAAHFMQRGEVDAVIVGADRIAANGDTANKIGTYGLAVLCAHHGIPFYVAAPISTFDLNIESGDEIPIEERSPVEVTRVFDRQIAPHSTKAAHPAFDVTPHHLIRAIVTENGVIESPDKRTVPEHVRGH